MEINKTPIHGDMPRSFLGSPKILREKPLTDPDLEAVRDIIVQSEKEGMRPPDMASIKKSRAGSKTFKAKEAGDVYDLKSSTKPFPSQRYLTVGEAFKQHSNGAPILDHGTFVKFLPPDLNPPRHQIFIIKMDSGPEVKVAHNSDVAATLPDSVKAGDKLELKGDYIYNDKGGIVHWTHHVDEGSHEPGYIIVEKTGQKYD